MTAALAALGAARGERVAVVKAAQTGAPADVEELRRLSGAERRPRARALRRAARPGHGRAPGRRAGPGARRHRRGRRALRDGDRELVLIEGAGGLLVRLDASGGDDRGRRRGCCDAPVLVVARAGLGTLNQTALTCEALRARGLACAGVVIGAWPADPDLAARCNLEDLRGLRRRARCVGRRAGGRAAACGTERAPGRRRSA